MKQGSLSMRLTGTGIRTLFFPEKHYVVLLMLLFLACSTQYALTHEKIRLIADENCATCSAKDIDDILIFTPQNNRFYAKLFPADPDFAADLIWLRTAYYYGLVSSAGSQDFFYLPMLLDVIIDLAPNWEFPYFFGAYALLFESGFRNKGFQLLQKGMKNIPGFWELWVFKGIYLLKKEKDYSNAAKLIAEASIKKGAPQYLAALSVTLAQKSENDKLLEDIVGKLKLAIRDKKLLKKISDKL